MIKEYVCLFSKENKKEQLKFKIYQNELTEIWSSVIKENISKGYTTPKGFISTIKSTRETVNNQILNLIKDLKKYDTRFNLEWPEDYKQVTNSYLNNLHEQFHFIEEEIKANNIKIDTEFSNALHLVNVRIHELEHTFVNQKQLSWYINDGYSTSIPVTDNLRKFWRIRFVKYYRPGTLFLGYHTIGKTLFDCYETNDIALVEKEGIRQQELISSEVIFIPNSWSQYDNTRKIKKWLKQNNFSIDMNNPKYRYNHTPELGYLKTDLSKDKVAELFTEWDFYSVDIN